MVELSWQRLNLVDADIRYCADFIPEVERLSLFEQLQTDLDWRQDDIHLFGRWVKIPRLQAWYGDQEAEYRYSGLSLSPQPFPPCIEKIRQQIQQATGYQFNAVLANLYRHGQDSMGWHSDNEKELGPNPVIASLSLGEPRRFQFKHRKNPQLRDEILLQSGSLLLMAGSTQHHWLHGVPKQARIQQPRINLTFRRIVSGDAD